MLKGMTNLCMYQFEDIAWDEFCPSDDHIVPQPGLGNLGDCFTPGGSLKRHICELTTSSCNTRAEDRSIARYANQGREQRGVSSTLSKRRRATLEKDSWSPTSNASFDLAPDRKLMKKGSSLASDDTMLSSHGLETNNTNSDVSKFCGHGSTLCDKSTTIDNNSLSYLLDEIDHTSNDLDFLNNADRNDSDDFLYYGWPEVGNFEDVDQMFRDRNSTFDLGIGKQDEFGWLLSADGLSGDVLKSDVKFPSPEPNLGGNILESTDSLKRSFPHDTSMNNAPIGSKDSYQTSEETDSYMPSVTWTVVTDNKDGFIPHTQGREFNGQISPRISANNHSRSGGADMINETKAHNKTQNQSEGQSKGHCFRNDGVNHIHGMPNEVTQLPSGITWNHTFPSAQMQQHDQCPISNSHPLDTISYIYSDNSNMSDRASVNMKPSIVKSDTNDLTQLLQRHSTCASNQLQHMKSSHDPPFEDSALAGHRQSEKLYGQEGSRSSANSNTGNRSVTTSDPGTAGKYMNHSEHGGVRLSTTTDIGSLNVQETLTPSSALDDISLEAASILQLQLVMDQLDWRTKSCIRYSLYRLAQSADQRNSCASSKTGSGDEKASKRGASVAEGMDKCGGFASMETNTNPLDRSVAHLLFHQGSHSSPTPAQNSFPFKSPTMVNRPAASPPILLENLVSEETFSGV